MSVRIEDKHIGGFKTSIYFKQKLGTILKPLSWDSIFGQKRKLLYFLRRWAEVHTPHLYINLCVTVGWTTNPANLFDQSKEMKFPQTMEGHIGALQSAECVTVSRQLQFNCLRWNKSGCGCNWTPWTTDSHNLDLQNSLDIRLWN